ncbi:MAG: RNA polymerase sigma factor [Gemmatimonadota bacterium]
MSSPSDERALVTRVIEQRDEAAFRALYRLHTPALYRLALRLSGGSGATADEAVHDAWIRAAEGLAGFEWRSALRTWLTGILLNCLREGWRETAEPTEPLDDHVPASATISVELRIDLETALRELAPGYRSVLVLHDIEGYTHEEIAALLGIDAGTSKSQLARGRRVLRRRLERSGESA